jgi:hypothetical protein
MDNRYPRAPRAGWSRSGRQSASAPAHRVALAASALLACVLAPHDLAADPVELADDRELPLGSIEEFAPSAIEYRHQDVADAAPSAAPYVSQTHEGDSNKRTSKAYEQYAGQPSRPDRWDHAGPQFPWLEFPGCDDDWRVGPVLGVRFDALFLQRTDAASDFLTNTLGAMPPYVMQPVNQFEYAGGARAYVTSQNRGCYNVQLGYIGAAEWNASAASQFTNLADPLQDETRLNSYDSSLHAVELNVLPYSKINSQLFMGARYVDFSEDFTQFTDRVNFDINNDNLATGLNDDLRALKIDNRMLGAHMGLRRDIWSRNRRFSLEALINGGPFCNLISREEGELTIVTVNPPDDPATVADESQQTVVRVGETVRRRRASELAFFGETALTGVYRFHPCLSIRGGYQAVWLCGAHLASDQFGETSSVFFHGAHFGVEYRR